MPQLPFFPYPPSKEGYWSPVTSTLNWCEEVGLRAFCDEIKCAMAYGLCVGLLCHHLFG